MGADSYERSTPVVSRMARTCAAIFETQTMSSHCPWFAPRCSNLSVPRCEVHCLKGIGSPILHQFASQLQEQPRGATSSA